MRTNKFTAVEVYSGAGGMSLGARMCDIDVKLAVEIDKDAAKTYKHNHPSCQVIVDDIKNIKEVNIETNRGNSIMFGGPPCQGFSLSNKRNRNSTNPKNWLFKEFIRVAKIWKPKWVVIENVSGLLTTEKGLFLKLIISELEDLGYTCSYKLLNAVDYGVPQRRERLFIVGSNEGINFEFPKKIGTIITVKDTLSDLPDLLNGAQIDTLEYKTQPKSEYSKLMRKSSKLSLNNYVTKNNALVVERYKTIPQGKNWSVIPDYLMQNYKDKSRCHGGIYYRLKEDEPSVVIGNYRKNMLIHPTQDRGLSVREAARIQSFPDSYEFKGSFTSQQQQVGDAVPPLLAKAIFSEIILQAGLI
jgi:DNA (cytosine-5)-methyltransferase 1